MRHRYISQMLAIVLLSISLLMTETSTSTAAPGPDRTEKAVTVVGTSDQVSESIVRIKSPLPKSVGPHPAACNWLSYLRYRDTDGPQRSADADRILIAQPGVLEGASAFDTLARNTIARAAEQGVHLEFWALDRRSNCLEDHTGVDASIEKNNPGLAVDYYYRGRTVNGKRFGGYRSNQSLKWLSAMGLAQTVEDQYALMRAELPEQRTRRDKVLCGGHSLGGVITAYFAQWDFGGDPGYKQCGGYFALDSAISLTVPFAPDWIPSDLVGQLSAGTSQIHAGIEAGVIPASANLPALINPETMNLLAIAGAAARTAPSAESRLMHIQNPNIDTSLRILFSRDGTEAATLGTLPVRQIRLTNTAALGSLLDNNSQPLAFLQTANGFYRGGPVVDKDFPLPNALNQSARSFTATALGPDRLALPTARGPLYDWANFNEVQSGGARSSKGQTFTAPNREVTDINQLASNLADHPLDFTEQYFPTMLLADTIEGPAHLKRYLKHSHGITANHTLALVGGSGLTIGHKKGGTGTITTVVAPGYHHLDVLTASATQNNGRPEPVSTALAAFAAKTPRR